jgi:hypothetical protein
VCLFLQLLRLRTNRHRCSIMVYLPRYRPSRTGPLHKPKKGHQSWFVIPQWKINQGRRHLYQDYIHFAGREQLVVYRSLCNGFLT